MNKLTIAIALVVSGVIGIAIFLALQDQQTAKDVYYRGVFDDCMSLTYTTGDPAPFVAMCNQHVKDAKENNWYEFSQRPDSYWTPIPGGQGG